MTNYCQKLLQALNQWKQALDELKNAKDEYLRYFTEEKRNNYQQKREATLKARDYYFQVKEESYVNVKIEDKEEKIFAPEYEALERLYQGCGLRFLEKGYIKVENGRVVKLELNNLSSFSPQIIQKRTEAFKNIRYLPKLRELYCSNNNLLELDVSQNKELEILRCSFNKLKHLDVSQNKKLRELYCSNNNLLELDVSQNKELEILDCSFNNLKHLDVSQDKELKELYCYYNQLQYLDVSQNKKLEILYCFNNQLQHLDISQNEELIWLSCSNNKLQHLDVSRNKKLKKLLCFNNKLQSLDVSQNKQLEEINCSYNFLPLEVCQQIETQTNIKTLDLYPQYPIEILNFLNDLKQQNLTLEEAKMQFAKEIQKFKEDIYKDPQKLELYRQWKLTLPFEDEYDYFINLIF